MRLEKFTIIICLLLLQIIIGCDSESNKEFIFIRGNLTNLPDGKLILHQSYSSVNVDSVFVKDGKFSFSISTKKYPEPILVSLIHYDKDSVKRVFSFPTKRTYKGTKLSMNSFLLEDNSYINGTLKGPGSETSFALGKVKLVSIELYESIGKQTDVMYNDIADFPNIRKINAIKEVVKKAPYSFYYLYELKKNVSHFSNEQFLSVLNCFDKNVREGKTGKELYEYIHNRKNLRLGLETQLNDNEGIKVRVLKEGQLNMVVLWASWCGPCRQEIPILKKVFEKYKSDSNFRMVSVSLDKDDKAWMKALEKEKMDWEQLIITPELSKYQQDIFQFDRSIPTTIFVDKKGKIIHKITGFDAKDGLRNLDNFIASQLNTGKKAIL